PASEKGMGVVGMVRPVEGWSEPELPVETFRYGRGVRGKGGELRPHRPVRPVVDLPQGPDGAVIDPRLDGADAGALAGGEEMSGDPGAPRRFDHGTALEEAVGQWLVHYDTKPLLHGGDGHRGVEVVGGHDLDGVEVP